MGHTKRISRYLMMAGITLLVSTLCAFAAGPVITPQKAADVNDVAITMLTLNNEYRQILKQKGMAEEYIPENQVAAKKRKLLDSLIDLELLFQESRKNNILVDEEKVNAEVLKAKECFETESAYQDALRDANMRESDILARIRKVLAINEFVDEKISRQVVVTDAYSMVYYETHPDFFQRAEKVRASHILLRLDRDAGEAKKVAAREKIGNIRRRITAGEDFATLAREYSDCPSSENGGELGYFERGEMAPEFEAAAFELPIGSLSEVVQTDFGFHLILVIDKIASGTIAYETVEPDLENFLKQKKIQTEVSSLIETLRSGAKIEIYL